MKKLTMVSGMVLLSIVSSFSASADAFDVFVRQQLPLDVKKKLTDSVNSAHPTATRRDRTLNYYVRNSSGNKIEALYLKGATQDSWSGNCLVDSATLDWVNTHTLHLERSHRLYGTPGTRLQPGNRERDLNGNYWWTAGTLVVDVPLGGYDDCEYHMKVRWEDGTEREFKLPYPYGDVAIYTDQLKVCLGVDGRGLFYSDRIAAE